MPVLPFLSLGQQSLMVWGGSVFVVAELTWWAGILLLGPELVALAKRYWRALQQYRQCRLRRMANPVVPKQETQQATRGAMD